MTDHIKQKARVLELIAIGFFIIAVLFYIVKFPSTEIIPWATRINVALGASFLFVRLFLLQTFPSAHWAKKESKRKSTLATKHQKKREIDGVKRAIERAIDNGWFIVVLENPLDKEISNYFENKGYIVYTKENSTIIRWDK